MIKLLSVLISWCAKRKHCKYLDFCYIGGEGDYISIRMKPTTDSEIHVMDTHTFDGGRRWL